jgi:hypothetical protein
LPNSGSGSYRALEGSTMTLMIVLLNCILIFTTKSTAYKAQHNTF